MKNLRLLLLLAVSIIFLVPACTFQKRVHNRGFHIDWSGPKTDTKQKDLAKNGKPNKVASPKEIAPLKEDSVSEELHTILSEPMPQVSAEAGLAEPMLLPKVKENYFKKEFHTQKEQIKKIAKPLEKKLEKEINILSVIGLILGIMSISLLFALFIFEIEIFALTSLLFGILSIVLSSLSLRQFRENPDRWTGKGIAIGGLIAGILSILFWLILIIFVILLLMAWGGGF